MEFEKKKKKRVKGQDRESARQQREERAGMVAESNMSRTGGRLEVWPMGGAHRIGRILVK